MKVTKAQMVDFIYHNFTRDGKKIPKNKLNQYSVQDLSRIIEKNNCEKAFESWINRPKLIEFMVDGVQDGKNCSWDCEYPSQEECRKAFEDEGVTVVKIALRSTHHRCKYCNGIAEGKNKDLLCDECREIFHHTYFSEL